jgi:hypothetical protein
MMQAPKHTRATLYSSTTHEWARDALLQLSTTLDPPTGSAQRSNDVLHGQQQVQWI